MAEPRRRRARRLQPARIKARWDGDGRGPRLPGGQPARRLRRARHPARGRSRSTGCSTAASASTRPTRRGRGLLRSFTDLRTGDFIVHEDHGVARFAGFDTKTVGGITRDYLNLEFQGDDKVFMPVDQLAKISRYVGADGNAPSLSKLGGKRWDTIKAARPARRAGARRRAAQPLRRAQAPPRLRVRARLGLAARVRGGVPVPRDARPARGDRGGQGRHGVRAPDGPADLRRRRLRQDRGRAARRVQVGERRQAGADARPDDDPRPAALRHVRRAAARLPVHDRAGLPLPPRRRAARGGQALRRGQGRHPDRHPPRALARRAREGPRADHRRRGAALRRQAEGAAAPAQAEGRRDHA